MELLVLSKVLIALKKANWKDAGSGGMELAEFRPWKVIILKR